MNGFQKFGIAAALVLGISLPAQAVPFRIDVGAAGSAGTTIGAGTDADTLTGLVDSWQVFTDTTLTVDAAPAVGVGFSVVGDGVFTGPLPGVDVEGIGLFGGSAITATFELDGIYSAVNAGNLTQEYTGGLLTFFFQDIGAVQYDFGGGVGLASTSGGAFIGAADNSGFGAGTQVLQLQLENGVGSSTIDGLGNALTGSFDFNLAGVQALPEFWQFDSGEDFAAIIAGGVLSAVVDANTDDVNTVGTATDANSDGSVTFGFTPVPPTPVPEPGTMMLLGAGLLGILRFRRRENLTHG